MTKTKKILLQEANQEIVTCPICIKNKVGRIVVGEGSAHAKIVFIGEAPGKTESITGRPFVGRSGKLLRTLINDIGLTETDIYITSAVKYLPVKKTPTSKEIAHGKIHLDKQLNIINPKMSVLLGLTAYKAIFSEPALIKEIHGHKKVKNGKTYFITYHPAAALRFPKAKVLLTEDFKTLKKHRASFLS